MRSVEIDRPRCGHKLQKRCFDANKLKADWEMQYGDSALDRMYFILL